MLFALRYEEELTLTEIAEIMHLPAEPSSRETIT